LIAVSLDWDIPLFYLWWKKNFCLIKRYAWVRVKKTLN